MKTLALTFVLLVCCGIPFRRGGRYFHCKRFFYRPGKDFATFKKINSDLLWPSLVILPLILIAGFRLAKYLDMNVSNSDADAELLVAITLTVFKLRFAKTGSEYFVLSQSPR